MSDVDQITDAERDLEAALRSLHPAPARLDVAAAGRVAAARHAAWRGRRTRRVALAAGIAAVVAAGAALNWHGRQLVRVHQRFYQWQQQLVALGEAPPRAAPPTLLAYRRALAQSPAELDAMLARQAAAGGAPSGHVVSAGLPTFWNPDASPFPGTL